jgi:hypothetical protein
MNDIPANLPTRRIQIVIDEETYQNFQLLRRQTKEQSDSSLGRKIISDYVLHELNVAGTQRHFQATFQEHLQRNEWLTLLIVYMLATTLAAITKLTGNPKSARDIILESASRFTQSHGRFNAEITRYIDLTEDL